MRRSGTLSMCAASALLVLLLLLATTTTAVVSGAQDGDLTSSQEVDPGDGQQLFDDAIVPVVTTPDSADLAELATSETAAPDTISEEDEDESGAEDMVAVAENGGGGGGEEESSLPSSPPINNVNLSYPNADTEQRGHDKDPDLLDGDNPGWFWTDSPTALPTLSPTALPTASPTLPIACEYTDYGSFFTSSNGVDALNAIPIEIEVPFFYEVETNVEYTAEEMNADVLPKVEMALAEGMLPGLFPDECVAPPGTTAAGSGGGRSGTATGTSDGSALDGKVVGITTDPPDVTITNPSSNGDVLVPCDAAVPLRPGASCAKVEGSLTLYIPSDYVNQTDDIVAATQNVVQGVMSSGSLDNGLVDDTVERVVYGGDGPYDDPPLEVTALNTGEASGESKGGFPYYIAAASGAVAVGAVLLIVGAKMRSSRRNNHEDEDLEDKEEEEESYNDNASEMVERGGEAGYDMGSISVAAADL